MPFGRLERPAAPPPISEINMTPLVDVMLVLVVILIVTAPLLASALRLDLPRSAAATPGAAPHVVTLVLDPRGPTLLDGRPVTAAQLAAGLAQAAARDPGTELQLRADAAVPYGRVAEAIGLAQQAGLHRIGFVAAPQRPAPAAR